MFQNHTVYTVYTAKSPLSVYTGKPHFTALHFTARSRYYIFSLLFLSESSVTKQAETAADAESPESAANKPSVNSNKKRKKNILGLKKEVKAKGIRIT